ncbi:MAG: NADH-ubiquinone oxidoreductase chain N [uncultured Chloroflexi bacterium]|uniref:NADH-quinone oxidoreductase subunit N n=1 Tax=uncultured Chloroflexota bacterium TaxID=166587 RepID=A0A6J4JUC7_9CHLR|nr:MAG: NADH-ubiquinone oxidoreductase chain N [uncultured Chloroflexota bacterium]
MAFDINNLDYSLITPDLMLLGLIFVALALDLILPRSQKWLIGWVTIAGLVGSAAAAVSFWGVRENFAGVIRIDEYSVFFTVTFLLASIGVALISLDYVDRFLPHPGEYYGLLISGTLGMVLMAQANELLTAYISLELLSFSSYVLVSYAKTNLKSNEAGLKYIILGAFSSALLLYAISLVYGTTGTTYLPDVARAIGRMGDLSPAFMIALALLIAGLGFKIAAVPFHMWTPDVYEGAPTPVTAYLSVSSKAAGFALTLRILVGGFLPLQEQYQTVFGLLAVLTMTLGNLVALQQRNVKRLLAYSSISQAGYVLVGMAALSRTGDIAEMATRGMMLHLLGYVFTNLASFGALIAFQNTSGGREMLSDMAGFARRAPVPALAMMAGLFSLAGMPLFAGFVTKFYLFTAATRAGLLWLVAIAVINSTISLYYYLLVVYEMYVRTPPGFEEADGHAAHGRVITSAAAASLPLMEGYHGTRAGTVYQAAEGGTAVALMHATAVGQNGHSANGHATGHSAATHDAHGSPAIENASDGHAPAHGAAAAHGNGHGVAHGDGHGDGHGGHGEDFQPISGFGRGITDDMTKERYFPPVRVGWPLTLGLLLFMAGIFYIGIYPTPIMDALQDASRSLFVS